MIEFLKGFLGIGKPTGPEIAITPKVGRDKLWRLHMTAPDGSHVGMIGGAWDDFGEADARAVEIARHRLVA